MNKKPENLKAKPGIPPIGITLLDSTRNKVHLWSTANFGNNAVDSFDCLAPHCEKDGEYVSVPHIRVELDWLAPLMGIGEEIGELSTACIESNTKEILDSIGDIGIFCCDYLARMGRTFQQVAGPFDSNKMFAAGYEPRRANLTAAYGKLLHVHLKKFQNIRGMGNPEVFFEAWSSVMGRFVMEVHHYAYAVHDLDFAKHTADVFVEVQKRDWNKARAINSATPVS